MAFRSGLWVAGTSLLVGCSLVTSLADLGATDASTAGDASSGNDAATNDGSAADAGGNLVENPSFDDGQGGCGPGWGNGYGMSFTRVSPGRTGPYACEVCITPGSQDSFQLQSLPLIPVQAGTSYYAEGWLMTPEGGVAVQAGVGILTLFDADAGITCVGGPGICQGSILSDPPSTWQKTTVSFTTSGPSSVTLAFHAYDNTATSCFVLDDVAVYAQ
ncbi:MAG TPA: hypothetical protein VGH28_28920 [Polyangiaceae bacterium]|jgi:hypothetical protein